MNKLYALQNLSMPTLKTKSNPYFQGIKLKPLSQDIFFKSNDKIDPSDNLPINSKDELKRKQKIREEEDKARKRESWKQRAIAVGLDPDKIDHNKLMKWERALKVGADPETVSYKELNYLEEKARLLEKAKALKIDLKDTKTEVNSNFNYDNLNNLKESIEKADDELYKKIYCKGLNLDDNASWEEIHEILDGIEESDNVRMYSHFAKYAESGNIEDLIPKKEDRDIVTRDDIREKCDEIHDAIINGELAIDDIDKVIKINKKN